MLTFSSELFGPILPIIAVDNLEEAIHLIGTQYVHIIWLVLSPSELGDRPAPLVIYAFTSDEVVKEKRR